MNQLQLKILWLLTWGMKPISKLCHELELDTASVKEACDWLWHQGLIETTPLINGDFWLTDKGNAVVRDWKP